MPFRLSSAVLVLGLLTACQPPAGRLDVVEVDSQAEGQRLEYGVYLPPGYDGERPLPLVLLLHGAGDDARTSDRIDVMTKLDSAIERGDLPPFIMVTPEGDRGFWVNWYDGSHHWKDWVMNEAIPAVIEAYPIEHPDKIHFMGVSMGGGGGMQLWLSEQERFASASILSAPILDDEGVRKFLRRFLPKPVLERAFGPPGSTQGIDPYEALATPEGLAGNRVVFSATSKDLRGIRESTEAFHRHLRNAGVPHRYFVHPGSHGWKAWSDAFPQVLCWQLRDDCSMTPPPTWTVAKVP